MAVRSRTEALADWYKAGEQLVQNPWLSTKFICPNCPTVAVLEIAYKQIAEKQNLLIINQLYFLV